MTCAVLRVRQSQSQVLTAQCSCGDRKYGLEGTCLLRLNVQTQSVKLAGKSGCRSFLFCHVWSLLREQGSPRVRRDPAELAVILEKRVAFLVTVLLSLAAIG